ncbi:MAG: iron-sulfur cluster repair di-iron protein [Bacteroidetes bacterium]|nr:iron-sulfur cluster repair di-iron protein [Bacteroidota bacterium]
MKWNIPIHNTNESFEEDFSGSPVGNIVAADIRKADVMKKYGIDFCCGGGEILSAACKTAGVSAETVNRELNQLQRPEVLASQNPWYWAPDFLCDYIVNTHHNYIRNNSRYILEYGSKVMRTHGTNHPELLELGEYVSALLSELHQHMTKEENILFPRIKQMFEAYRQPNEGLNAAISGMNINMPVEVMELEHKEAGDLLHRIRECTDDYIPPADVCLTYKVYYAKLQEFEEDLTMHIHLENNILFPKALDMQAKFLV